MSAFFKEQFRIQDSKRVGQGEPNPELGIRMTPITWDESKKLSKHDRKIQVVKRTNFYYVSDDGDESWGRHDYITFLSQAKEKGTAREISLQPTEEEYLEYWQ
jgi:hypothetical protein